jgi:hypothetical protein
MPRLIRLDAIFGHRGRGMLTHWIFWRLRHPDNRSCLCIWPRLRLRLAWQVWLVPVRRDQRFKLQAALSYQLAWLLAERCFSPSLLLPLAPVSSTDILRHRPFRGVSWPGSLTGPDRGAVAYGTTGSKTQGQWTRLGRRHFGHADASKCRHCPSLRATLVFATVCQVGSGLASVQCPGHPFRRFHFHLGWHYASDGIVRGN